MRETNSRSTPDGDRFTRLFSDMTARRFPPPWSVEDTCAAFIVKDAGGQKLGYFYYEEEPGRRSSAKLLTQRRGAANCCKFCETAAVANQQITTGRTFLSHSGYVDNLLPLKCRDAQVSLFFF
jgi:hypothetical protein